MEAPSSNLPKDFDGLVGELSKLKTALGYAEDDSEEVKNIKKYAHEVMEENEELRRVIESAILEAQSLREDYDTLQQENESLLAELNAARMNDVVAKTQELNEAAYEFDRDVVETCVAEAETYRQEVEELQQRIEELEQENTGLNQTLSEMRQSQQQLSLLQKSQDAGLLSTPSRGSVAGSQEGNTPFGTPEGTPGITGEQLSSEKATPAKSGTGEVSPVRLAFNILPAADNVPSSSPVLPAGSSADDPIAIADALAAVAGGAEGGVVATAAKMLYSYGDTHSKLIKAENDVQKLTKEVDELHETMTSKTFKAPSAWAEREVKYKQDKRRWEEEIKEKDVKIEAIQREVEQLRSGAGASALETRIQDLEAQVLQTQRERDAARSALHELQLSLRTEGEFGNAGVRTSAYHGLSIANTVEHLESISHTVSSPSESNKAAVGGGEMPTVDKPRVGPLRLTARTEEIERQLAQVENARAAIESELNAITNDNARRKVDWEAQAMATELLLLKKGVPAVAAYKLATLDTELQQLALEEKETTEVPSSSAVSNKEEEQEPKNEEGVSPMEEEANVQTETKDIKENILEAGDDDAVDESTPAPSESEVGVSQQKADILAEIQELVEAENLDAVTLGLPSVSLATGVDSPRGDSPSVNTPMAAAGEETDSEATAMPEPELAQEAVERIQELEACLAKSREATVDVEVIGSGIVVPSTGGQEQSDADVATKDPAVGSPTMIQPIKLEIALPAGPDERDARIKALEAMLEEKKKEEENLRMELQNIPPVRLQLNIGERNNVSRGSSGASSGNSLAGVTMEGLAKDRAEADIAWAEHKKNTDGPALLRAKAELEARCALLESQLAKAQEALESAQQDQAAMEEQIDNAMSTGDVGVLSSWRDKIKSSSKGLIKPLGSPRKSLKMFKRKNSAPSKQAMATALAGTQEALQDADTERNALRRQLARMSEKMKGMAEGGSPTPGGSPLYRSEEITPADEDLSLEDAAAQLGDVEVELHSLREENSMLMEQLVETKVKFAETHGDYLESRRALLRAQERQLQLSNQIKSLQNTANQASSHLRPLQSGPVTQNGE